MTDPSKLIGYEALISLYDTMKASTPDGVGLKKVKVGETNYVQLQFKVGDDGKRVNKACNCSFTEDGIRNAVLKAQKVAEALRKFSTESEFWSWYDAEILEKNVILNDLITFGEVIKLIEDDFWASQTKTKHKRNRDNPSHQTSWYNTYGQYYKHLPSDKAVNLPDIMTVIGRRNKGDKSYKDCVGAMRKLARFSKKASIVEALGEINAKQTKFRQDLQTVDVDAFLAIRNKVLGVTEKLHFNADINSRKNWMWVFSMQLVYGLRVHEVFAILNLHKPYKMPDGVIIPALNDPSNKTNVIVIGEFTNINTTTKTADRLAAPIPHPRYPDLIERLEIKSCHQPQNKPREDSKSAAKAGFYSKVARSKLVDWHLDLTQTHALRHLANMNGHTSGVNPMTLAQSLGHSITINESTYTKRQATKTKLDLLLNSQKQPLGFTSAITTAKTVLQAHPSRQAQEAVIEALAAIYHSDLNTIADMLR